MTAQPVSGYADVAVRIAILGTLAFASYRAILVAWADFVFRQATPAALEKAERLMPSYALYHYAHALALEQNEPRSPAIENEFETAIALNPRYSDALLAWSVEREIRGDKPGSERLLLKAKDLDRLLRPTWALANFYYRQGKTDAFLPQARESLRIIGVSGVSEGRFDLSPIYDLCWKSGASADAILSKAIPDIPIILAGYLSFVLHTGRVEAAPAIVARMMPNAEPGEMMFLRPYLENLLARQQVSLAAQTWRQLYSKKMVPYPGPDAAQGAFLTNGDIQGAPLDFGFDWRRAFPESVQFSYLRLEHAYRFDFDGAEPEKLGLLVQVLPFLPNRSYTFEARFESDLNPEPGGLRWNVRDRKSGQSLKTRTSVKTQGDSKTLVMDFETPASVEAGDLTLSYDRVPGTARLHGFYQLQHADLRLADSHLR